MELSDKPHAFCGRQIRPQVDLSLLKGWLEFCNTNHKTLCRKSSPPLPQGFRVIDCLSRRTVLWENVARAKEYTTLSYVWGDHVVDSTTSNDFPLGPLPTTIEDAMLLTKGLGYQYLWIDRYCISQDNPIERQLQIRNMKMRSTNSLSSPLSQQQETIHIMDCPESVQRHESPNRT